MDRGGISNDMYLQQLDDTYALIRHKAQALVTAEQRAKKAEGLLAATAAEVSTQHHSLCSNRTLWNHCKPMTQSVITPSCLDLLPNPRYTSCETLKMPTKHLPSELRRHRHHWTRSWHGCQPCQGELVVHRESTRVEYTFLYTHHVMYTPLSANWMS